MVHILSDWRVYAAWTLSALIVASVSFSVGQAFSPSDDPTPGVVFSH